MLRTLSTKQPRVQKRHKITIHHEHWNRNLDVKPKSAKWDSRIPVHQLSHEESLVWLDFVKNQHMAFSQNTKENHIPKRMRVDTAE